MFFKDIAGQKTLKSFLIESYNKGRIPHAMLFNGPEGNGKLALAIAFARYIACKNKHDGDACGQCSSCVKFNKLEHPDLHFVFPVVKKGKVTLSDDYIKPWRSYLRENTYVSIGDWMNHMGADNKQPMIYTDESEAIVKKALMKSYEGDYKFMIVYFPERMHVSCANKLLKLIEEPPEKTLFFLVTENMEKLLTTIISRCQIISVPRIAEHDFVEALKTDLGINDEQGKELARLSNGNYVKAKHIHDDTEELKQNFDAFVNLMRKAYMRDIVSLKSWSDEMAVSGREHQKAFLEYSQRMVRENFVLNIKQKDLSYLNQSEYNFSEKFAPFINERNVIQIYEELDLAERQIEQNVHGKMVFFDLCLKMIMLLKS